MAIKDDLFSTVSPATIGLKQEAVNTRKAKKRIVTQAERYRIGKLLEENLSKQDENGMVSYLNDMTDYKIAKIIGPHVSHDTVRNMRQQVFGIVRKAYPLRKDKVDTLARIARLEEMVSILSDMFNQLAEEIGSKLHIN